MSKKRGLGRGLDALLGAATHHPVAVGGSIEQPPSAAAEAVGGSTEQPPSATAEEETAVEVVPTQSHTTAAAPPEEGRRLRHLPIEQIQRGRFQPRREFNPEALKELADSIAAQGVIQPIVVRPLASGAVGYELIAGERRWRAAQQAGLDTIPALVREVDDQAALALALIENIQRQDLNPLEEASALQRLLEEFALTHQQVAQAVGRSRSAVTNLLRILELNEEVRDHLERGRIDLGHAKVLLALEPQQQSSATAEVVRLGLSVRETERLVRRLQGEGEEPSRSTKPRPVAPDPDVERLMTNLSERLGAKVDLRHGQAGKGRLVISYNSLDELDGILAHIQ